MEFYDVINTRRTVREWTGEDVAEGTIQRILQAGLMAPTNNHMRQWEFILLHDEAEKKKALQFVKDYADAQGENRNMGNATPAQKMYSYAMPRQHRMLSEAAWVILPLFRETTTFHPVSYSSLNSFSSIWCVIENIFLAATAEGLSCSMRIPVSQESKQVCKELNVPDGWGMPCYIGIGHPNPEAPQLEQYLYTPDQKIHRGVW